MLFWIKHKPNIGSDDFMEIGSDVQEIILRNKSDVAIRTQGLRTYTCITKINTRKGLITTLS